MKIIFLYLCDDTIPPCSACRPAATLFVDRNAPRKSTVFGSQPQHRRPDLGRQVLEGERGSLVYKIKAPADRLSTQLAEASQGKGASRRQDATSRGM